VVFTLLSARLDKAARAGTEQTAGEEGSDKLDTDAAAQEEAPTPASTGGAAGLALLAAVVLDGVPESVALGIAFTEGSGGLALLAAIFVSNFPEALVGGASMRAQGRSHRYVLGLWGGVAAVLVVPVVLGAGPLSQTSGEAISLPLAFAAGAVLASLADTLMPEAYEDGGPTVALSTAAGFVLSFVLSLA
jgi:ZIP family zinc transporter